MNYIRSAVDKVTNDLQPEVQNILGLIIEETELFQIVMFQPSTKNLFLEIKTQYLTDSALPLTERQMDFLISISELAKVIALVGDGAISMAVLHQLWSPESDKVGGMTQRRAEAVSNENLARVCDRWKLYEHRIHFDPPTPTKSEIEHIKGTLVEAVYGIIYVEKGLDGVEENIRHLTEVT
ncbi:MAG: ribonuclease III domain-containing protein [Candidatus Thorarchaeota archaeon]